MVKIEHITKDWNEAGSLAAQVNLHGFWDEYSFLTKSGDLGAALRIGGIDYESLDHAGRDYAVKRLEAAFRSLDDKCRLYQVLFKRNRPAIPHAEYENPLVRAAVEQRSAFAPPAPPQLQDQLRLESAGPAEHRQPGQPGR
jgi:type IV secretion system protein TrbE